MSVTSLVTKALIAGLVIKTFSDYLGIFNAIELPVGNLGTSRSLMPQIAARDIPAYIKWLDSNGVGTKKASVLVTSLKLTQNEINKDKVISLINQGTVNTPLLVSSDGYVIDGSHRFVAQWNSDRKGKVPTIRIDMKAMDLLLLTRTFPMVQYRSVSDKKVSQ